MFATPYQILKLLGIVLNFQHCTGIKREKLEHRPDSFHTKSKLLLNVDILFDQQTKIGFIEIYKIPRKK